MPNYYKSIPTDKQDVEFRLPYTDNGGKQEKWFKDRDAMQAYGLDVAHFLTKWVVGDAGCTEDLMRDKVHGVLPCKIVQRNKVTTVEVQPNVYKGVTQWFLLMLDPQFSDQWITSKSRLEFETKGVRFVVIDAIDELGTYDSSLVAEAMVLARSLKEILRESNK